MSVTLDKTYSGVHKDKKGKRDPLIPLWDDLLSANDLDELWDYFHFISCR